MLSGQDSQCNEVIEQVCAGGDRAMRTVRDVDDQRDWVGDLASRATAWRGVVVVVFMMEVEVVLRWDVEV